MLLDLVRQLLSDADPQAADPDEFCSVFHANLMSD
jgi:hypothetical protein